MASSKEIFVYVSYHRKPDLEFNMDYYLNKHLAIVDEHWKQFGLKSWSVIHFPEGDPSGIHTQAILHFESQESFDKAWNANIPEVMEDLKNYSNQPPTRWIGKVMKQG